MLKKTGTVHVENLAIHLIWRQEYFGKKPFSELTPGALVWQTPVLLSGIHMDTLYLREETRPLLAAAAFGRGVRKIMSEP